MNGGFGAGNNFGSVGAEDKLRHTPLTPQLLRDLARESVVWPKNRKLPEEQCYLLPRLAL